ncbi:MAG: hypothetical protein P8N56_05260 [Schleiferiaceae bacterium]|nr:hypothetical protein [Schleiferiaceae bacterium]
MEKIISILRKELSQCTLGKAPMIGDEALQARWKSLHRATFVGNLREEKVLVYLQGQGEDVFRLETTLWACTAEWAVFKEGIRIPVDAILRVEFYQASEE